ncbi:hypothetical protein ACH5RR_003323 [Cinchona calisaya]|uniref:Transposase-associated domain-containing protein n=1 Tax=Cinchona calisaya TaxID=153742 RepID=A0ABD3AUF9_9GENT
MDIRSYRRWMYDRLLPNGTGYTQHFLDGVRLFIKFVCSQPQYFNYKEIRCPCSKDQNRKLMNPDHVGEHILKYGFMEDYWYWTSHGESKPVGVDAPGTSSSNSEFLSNEYQNRYQSMVFDAVGSSNFRYEYHQEKENGANFEEPPNTEATHFYDMLQSAQRQLYPGCESFTKLSMAVHSMSLKLDYNLSQGCVHRVCDIVKRATPLGNCVTNNFAETKKLVKKLGYLLLSMTVA